MTILMLFTGWFKLSKNTRANLFQSFIHPLFKSLNEPICVRFVDTSTFFFMSTHRRTWITGTAAVAAVAKSCAFDPNVKCHNGCSTAAINALDRLRLPSPRTKGRLNYRLIFRRRGTSKWIPITRSSSLATDKRTPMQCPLNKVGECLDILIAR